MYVVKMKTTEKTQKSDEEDFIIPENSEYANVQDLDIPVCTCHSGCPSNTFADKLNALRKDIISQDWADDKTFMIGGKGSYTYLSAGKAKRLVSPFFAKHKLEFRCDFTELEYRPAIGQMTQHWTVKFHGEIIDVESGLSLKSTAYGEAGDSGDKGVNKAQTCAFKQWLTNVFILEDGIDPDADSEDARGCMITTRTPKEQIEVKSKLLDNAVPPISISTLDESSGSAVQQKSASSPKAPLSKKKAEPKSDVKEAPNTNTNSTDNIAIEPLNSSSEATTEPTPTHTASKLSEPQQKAINKILSNWTEAAQNGKVEAGPYNEMVGEQATIETASDAVKFIRKFSRSF